MPAGAAKKLDYLSKYLSGDCKDSQEDEERRKSKKKKKDKKHRHREPEELVKVNDEDDDVLLEKKLKPNTASAAEYDHAEKDLMDDDDEGPVVVDSKEIPEVKWREAGNGALVGKWEEVKDGHSGTRIEKKSRMPETAANIIDSNRVDRLDEESNRKRAGQRRRRYDSDDDSQHSHGHTKSHHKRRRRYDSSDDEDARKERKEKPRVSSEKIRYDSEDDGVDPKGRKHPSRSFDASPRQERQTDNNFQRRKTYNSEDDEPDRIRGEQSHRRKRYDSEDDEKDKVKMSAKPENNRDKNNSRRRRYDSEDEEDDLKRREKSSRIHRHDSGNEKGNTRKGRRYDSDDGDSANDRAKARSSRGDGGTKTRRHRDDSSSSTEERARDKGKKEQRRYDSSDDDSHDRERMSSGHRAGLQTGSKFSKEEAKIQHRRRNEAQVIMDKYGTGDTVYRDKQSGRKSEADLAAGKSATTKSLDPAEQRFLNTGRVQREQAVSAQQEFAELQQSSFARLADDAGLEALRKNEIRAGDPMAAQAARKQQNNSATIEGGRVQRPLYKGPPSKPNRFGIRPGFRWDGIDRGNGFEDKLLAKRASLQYKKEEAYRWSSAAM